jgi:hypothetical protein
VTETLGAIYHETRPVQQGQPRGDLVKIDVDQVEGGVRERQLPKGLTLMLLSLLLPLFLLLSRLDGKCDQMCDALVARCLSQQGDMDAWTARLAVVIRTQSDATDPAAAAFKFFKLGVVSVKREGVLKPGPDCFEGLTFFSMLWASQRSGCCPRRHPDSR